MDNTQRKTMRKTVGAFLLFLILKVVEELVIIPKVDTMGLISCIGGLLILFIYIRMDNKPLEVIGMLFSKHKFGKGLGLAFVLNLVPMVIVYGLEYRKYLALDGYAHLTVYYDEIGHSLSTVGIRMFLFWIVFGLFIALVHGVFYEMSFRGLLLTLASKSFPFGTVNLVQSVLYTFWYMFPVFRILLYYMNVYTKKQILTLALVLIVYEMITALKLGLLRRSTGSIWVCIIDHMMFTYIMDMIHIQYTANAFTQTDYSMYTRMIAYQAISMVIAILYYSQKMKKINAKKQAELIEESTQN